MFRNTGANAFAKNQTRLAYEDKRDLYCNVKLDIAQNHFASPQKALSSHYVPNSHHERLNIEIRSMCNFYLICILFHKMAAGCILGHKNNIWSHF